MNFELNEGAEIIASTFKDYDYSVGYHDIKPFNKNSDELVVLHRYPLNIINFDDPKEIDVCVWNIKNNNIDLIAKTDLWSWEQGSRLQWLDDKKLIFNIRNNSNFNSCIYNIETKKTEYLDNPFYSISSEKFLTLNYTRLWKFWKNYGYNSDLKDKNFQKKPKDDGIFLCDFKNQKKLILSIHDAVKLCGLENIDRYFFLAHPTFCPDGSKFVSLLRFFNDTNTLISYFILTDVKNLTNQILAKERATHFEWINNSSLVVYSRNFSNNLGKLRNNKFTEKYIISSVKKILNFINPKIKQKLLSTHYHLINLENPNQFIKLDENNLTEDGHPQLSSSGKYLITDTYANKEGFQKLMIHCIKKNKTYEIGKFKVASYLRENNLKYDLHPRWNNNDKLISIDSSHEGSRQSYIINIEKFIKKIS